MVFEALIQTILALLCSVNLASKLFNLNNLLNLIRFAIMW